MSELHLTFSFFISLRFFIYSIYIILISEAFVNRINTLFSGGLLIAITLANHAVLAVIAVLRSRPVSLLARLEDLSLAKARCRILTAVVYEYP